MKRSHRQILSFLAAAALTFCPLTQMPAQIFRPALTASAEDMTEGDFAYTVRADGAGVSVTQYNGEGGSVVIPDTIGGLPVTEIGSWAFFNGERITDIAIPDTVTAIGSSAFNACTGLTALRLPAALTDIGDSAFRGCTGLTAVSIPAGVTSVGTGAFASCTALAQIEIPESVTYIGASVFRDTPWLAAKQAENPLVIVNQILIDGTAAEGDAVIPDGVACIGSMAFSGCRALTGITMPDSVAGIGESAFYGCAGLTAIAIPESVTSIGYQAFGSCTALTELVIPDSVTELGGSVCFGCESLTAVTLSAGLTVIPNSAFVMCTKLTALSLPENVKTIDLRAFAACSSLTEIVIPEGAESIGFTAFAMCTALERITIPDSVISIGQGAFSGCENLTVYANTGSCAETYAQQFGLAFESTGQAAPKVPHFAEYAAANEQDGILTAADGGRWYKVREFENGQDYIITVWKTDGTMLMLTAGDTLNGFAWRCETESDAETGTQYRGLHAGNCALVCSEGQLSGDESLFPQGTVLWQHQDSLLFVSVNGQTMYLRYDESSETPFTFTDDPQQAVRTDIYTNGAVLAKCITEQPYAARFVLENSGYAAPEFRIGIADAVTDSITWYVDGAAQSETGQVFTADMLIDQPAGLHRVSCLIDAHDSEGYRFREMSEQASFVIAKGVLADSVLTFSGVQGQYSLIGDAIETVMTQNGGCIPSLILCDSQDDARMRAVLGGLDTVQADGSSDAADGIRIYGLKYDSIVSETEAGSVCSYENVLADTERFLQAAAADYSGELIVISAQTGLHVTGLQPESADSAQEAWAGGASANIDKSAEMAALLNSYAEAYGMNILYLFGHSQTVQEAGMLLQEGDTLYCPQSFADRTYQTTALHFTYANAGCLSRAAGSADADFSLITRGEGQYAADLIRVKDAVLRHTEIADRVSPCIASVQKIAEMAQKDFMMKFHTEVQPETAVSADGTLTFAMQDADGSTLETYVIDSKTGIGTDSMGRIINLPRTGVSDPGALLAVSGAVMMIALGAFLMYLSRRRKKAQE